MSVNSKCPVLLLDGGLGTTLQALDRKVDLDKHLWSSTPLVLDPAALEEVHGNFADAGADIVETATYQLSYPALAAMDRRNGVEIMTFERMKKVMRSAVALARGVADRGGKGKEVALSLGPYGATMNPSTEYSAKYDDRHEGVEVLKKWHKERIEAFVEDRECWAGVDYVAFETFGRCDEIRAVREVMTELVASGVAQKRWWISCVFPEAAGEGRLPSGETVDEAVEAMLELAVTRGGDELERPWGIGINCTKVGRLSGLIERMEGAVETVLGNGEEWPALLAYPDGTKAGESYDTTLQQWVVDTEAAPNGSGKAWHAELSEVVEATRSRAPGWTGIVVGGCCRTKPEDISSLRKCLH